MTEQSAPIVTSDRAYYKVRLTGFFQGWENYILRTLEKPRPFIGWLQESNGYYYVDEVYRGFEAKDYGSRFPKPIDMADLMREPRQIGTWQYHVEQAELFRITERIVKTTEGPL